jgi:hypothetical protein
MYQIGYFISAWQCEKQSPVLLFLLGAFVVPVANRCRQSLPPPRWLVLQLGSPGGHLLTERGQEEQMKEGGLLWLDPCLHLRQVLLFLFL